MKKILFFCSMLLGLNLLLTSCGNETNETTDNTENGDTTETALREVDENQETMEADKADVPIVAEFVDVDEGVKTHVEEVLEDYIKLKENLVEGNTMDAKGNAADLQAKLEGLRLMTLPPKQKQAFVNYDNMITEHTAQIAALDDIEEQRVQFSKISEGIYSLAQNFGADSRTLYYQYCPMAFNNKGAYWVSETKEIRNPFFGEKMMTCGSTHHQIN
ncbi:MAG: DUF3347 domain-containing protein [Bacteroidia bacterium]